jgi:hypothetical protein
LNASRSRQADAIRHVAGGAAAISALLYYLIGLGVLWVGSAKGDAAPDLFAFGAMTGTTFAVAALLLFRFRSRVLWVATAALQVLVIVGYFAVSGVRTPPFEAWGLLVKASQIVVLVAVAYLAVRAPRNSGRQAP